ncbi:MAG: acyl--CoA ligase [Pseudomonadales bacterium]|jgi:acyl-CoA synthetase (AMP-forming)/AMP-acid ligase II|nr:acyl--CoA ligase [Pseudomonadales bacterium]
MSVLIDLFSETDSTLPAIDAPDRSTLTHGALNEQIKVVGGELAALNIGADDRVAIVLPNGPLMASAFVCMSPWCATAPLNPAYKRDEFEFYLNDLDTKLLIVEAGSSSPVVDVAHKLGIRVVELQEKEHAGAFSLGHGPIAVENRRDDAIALILHTSGTTSRPKMVPLTQINLAASAKNISQTLHLSSEDRCMNVMPLFHIHGLMAPVLANISAGASVYCTPGFDALRFFSWLDAAQPTWYSAVPTMHQAILARSIRNEDSVRQAQLRFIRSSSASLPPQVMNDLEKTFGAPVVEAYAMTEAAHQMCSNPLPPLERKPGFVGPSAGPEVGIMTAEGHMLEQGQEGEIVIKGPNVTSGYLANDEANATAFHPGNWFRTGDQGIMDEAGYVKVTGRLKEIINRGGEKIAPLEIDEVILDHESVAQACSFAIPHDKLGEDVAAAIVLRDGKQLDEKELRQFVSERLADFKVPRKVVFVDEIPKGATGKIQRIGLAKQLGLSH